VLDVSEKTVDDRREPFMSRLNASGLAELIKKATREGINFVENSKSLTWDFFPTNWPKIPCILHAPQEYAIPAWRTNAICRTTK
jgi:hypothetical protein